MRIDPVRILACLAAVLAGCQETVEDGLGGRPLPREPRHASRVPETAAANAMVMNVSAAPLDTNGNGYADLIQVTVHLFDTRFAPPMREDGAFRFDLFVPGEASVPDARPLRTWSFEGDALARVRSRSAFGPCYQFRLSLLETGSDVLPIAAADVAGAFEPADGRPAVPAGETSSVQLGRRVVVPDLDRRGRGEVVEVP